MADADSGGDRFGIFHRMAEHQRCRARCLDAQQPRPAVAGMAGLMVPEVVVDQPEVDEAVAGYCKQIDVILHQDGSMTQVDIQSVLEGQADERILERSGGEFDGQLLALVDLDRAGPARGSYNGARSSPPAAGCFRSCARAPFCPLSGRGARNILLPRR